MALDPVVTTSMFLNSEDGNILKLIKKFLRSGVMEDGAIRPTRQGTPQGGVISPLLSNIVLNYLDRQMESKGYKFVRYADDFVVLLKTTNQAEDALEFIRSVTEMDLGLKLHPEKTKIVLASKGFEFLGFFVSSRTIHMRRKSVEKSKMKIRNITIRCHNLDSEVIKKLNQVIRGTVNYFGVDFANVMSQFWQLDKWIRKRIRCMKYKRISRKDNSRLRIKHINRLGLLSSYNLCQTIKV